MKEYESQVLEVDPETIIKRLRKLGAEKHEEVIQKRWVFFISEGV